MKIQLRFLVTMFAVAVAAMTTSHIAYSQTDLDRSGSARVEICPAPELVNTNIVLDQNHPNVSLSATVRRGPVLGRLPGGLSPTVPQVVPVEPQSSDEVLSQFDPDYGLNIEANEFIAAEMTEYGMIRCQYRSDRIEPYISIQTNSTRCSTGPGPWTATSADTATCNGSRRSCTFHCN